MGQIISGRHRKYVYIYRAWSNYGEIFALATLCSDPNNTGSIDKTVKEGDGWVSLDGSARNEEEKKLRAGLG